MAWAKVENNQVVQTFERPKAITMANGVQHPISIFRLWSEDELNAIGLYTIEEVRSSYDSRIQRRGGQSVQYNQEQNKVIRTDSVTNIPIDQIKEKYIADWKQQAYNLLKETDWKIIRELENLGKPVGADVKWFRNEIRLKSNEREAALTACDTHQQIVDYLDIMEDWPTIDDYTPLNP